MFDIFDSFIQIISDHPYIFLLVSLFLLGFFDILIEFLRFRRYK